MAFKILLSAFILASTLVMSYADVVFTEYLLTNSMYRDAFYESIKLSFVDSTMVPLISRSIHQAYYYEDWPFLMKISPLLFQLQLDYDYQLDEIIGDSFFYSKEFTGAFVGYERALEKNDDEINKTVLLNKIGLCYARVKKFEDAKHYLSVANTDQSRYFLGIIDDIESFKPKNKKVLSSMSLIPGGGYLYIGDTKTFLTSFIYTTGLGYLAYETGHRKMYTTSAVLSYVALSFYIGSIRGSHQTYEIQNKAFMSYLFEKLAY